MNPTRGNKSTLQFGQRTNYMPLINVSKDLIVRIKELASAPQEAKTEYIDATQVFTLSAKAATIQL